jgi:hypothetical protein
MMDRVQSMNPVYLADLNYCSMFTFGIVVRTSKIRLRHFLLKIVSRDNLISNPGFRCWSNLYYTK